MVLYDRANDPGELVNIAYEPEHHVFVSDYSSKLESHITAEIGADTRAWVTEKPQLLGWPTWRGDFAA